MGFIYKSTAFLIALSTLSLSSPAFGLDSPERIKLPTGEGIKFTDNDIIIDPAEGQMTLEESIQLYLTELKYQSRVFETKFDETIAKNNQISLVDILNLQLLLQNIEWTSVKLHASIQLLKNNSPESINSIMLEYRVVIHHLYNHVSNALLKSVEENQQIEDIRIGQQLSRINDLGRPVEDNQQIEAIKTDLQLSPINDLLLGRNGILDRINDLRSKSYE